MPSVIDSKTTGIAKKLRRSQTDAEQKIWSILRNNQTGFKFRRQQPIGSYIVDFFCADRGLIVEVDGSQHTEEKDKQRTEFLTSAGYRVLRFWNNDVFNNIEGISRVIHEALHTPHPGPLPQGERE